jgi:hypothetical protein
LARCRLCSRVVSRSPPGGSRGPIGWQPERGWGPVPQPGGQQVEVFAERRFRDGGLGNALIRDGNGCRSFETLLRYRGAAMAEFWRALKTLKALQAEQAATELDVAAPAPVRAQPTRRAAQAPLVHAPQPDEPERGATRRLQCAMPNQPVHGHALHEPAAPWQPKEPEPRQRVVSAPARPDLGPNEPGPRGKSASAPARTDLVPNEPGPHRVRCPE